MSGSGGGAARQSECPWGRTRRSGGVEREEEVARGGERG